MCAKRFNSYRQRLKSSKLFKILPLHISSTLTFKHPHFLPTFNDVVSSQVVLNHLPWSSHWFPKQVIHFQVAYTISCIIKPIFSTTSWGFSIPLWGVRLVTSIERFPSFYVQEIALQDLWVVWITFLCANSRSLILHRENEKWQSFRKNLSNNDRGKSYHESRLLYLICSLAQASTLLESCYVWKTLR